MKPEFREELEREQDELSQVLWAYRLTGAAIRPEIRAAAPEATRGLFDEIEALTGLDPEEAQPGAERWTWLSPGECGRRLGLPRPTVHARVQDYALPHRKEGKFMLVAFEPFAAHMALFPLHPTKGRPRGDYMTPERRWAEGPVGATVARGSIIVREVTPRELMYLYGNEVARAVLHRLSPGIFPAPKVA